MVLPNGETGQTDDSKYAMPGYCTIHSANSITIPPGSYPYEDETSPQQYAPGYIPQNPGANKPIYPWEDY
jgi:penicillin-binding protein 1A